MKKAAESPGDGGSQFTPARLAELLGKAGLGTMTTEMIEADIAAGAPAGADGRIHLLHYTAWLLQRGADGR